MEFMHAKIAVTVKFVSNTYLRSELMKTNSSSLLCKDSQENGSNISTVLGEVLKGVRSILIGVNSVKTANNIYDTKVQMTVDEKSSNMSET